jgi:hypothetical protein
MPGGLTGEQGVILPATNVPHLMLREEVVAAVAAGRFHLYPVRTIDEGIEILTGVPAGARDSDGVYPPNTVNGRVDRQLRSLAEKLQQFGQTPKNNGQTNGQEKKSDQKAEDERDAESEADEPDKAPPGEPELPGEAPGPGGG